MFFKFSPVLILISVITFSLGFVSYLCLLLLISCKLIFLSRPLTVGIINILCLGSSLFDKYDPCDLSLLTPVALVPTINYIFLFLFPFFWLLPAFTYSKFSECIIVNMFLSLPYIISSFFLKSFLLPPLVLHISPLKLCSSITSFSRHPSLVTIFLSKKVNLDVSSSEVPC